MPFKDTKTARDRLTPRRAPKGDHYKLHAAILMGLTAGAFILLTI